MPLPAPVMKTDFKTPGIKAFPSARLDHIFDAVERLGHITDVAPLAQEAFKQPVDAEPRCGAEPKRLRHVGAAARTGCQPVVPVVHCSVAKQYREPELAAGLARGHLARRPIHRSYLVSPNVTTKFGAECGAGRVAQPLGLEHFRGEPSDVSNIRDEVPDLVRGRRHMNS